jgi:hypothetical protein
MRHHAVRFGIACLLGLLALSASDVRAQQGILRGIVVDANGTPIEEAAVSVLALKVAIRADARGRFTLDRLAPGPIELAVRRLGFEPRTVKFTLTTAPVDSVRIVLTELPEVLSGVTVSANERHRRQMVEDFYFRRARGIGKFITREEILAQRASTVSDVLRTTPGIRLVRRNCPHCVEPYVPTIEEMSFFERGGGEHLTPEFRRGAGCNLCGGTGYYERVGVYEVLAVTEEVRELIVRGASHNDIRTVAQQQCMRPLRDQAIRLVAEGATTIAEVLRTVYVL